MFRIHMFLAGIGDSFLIEAGDSTVVRILIDTGMALAWRENILPALKKICTALDLAVITHIDRDHIGGATELFPQNRPHPLDIKEVWFNGLRQMVQDHAPPVREDRQAWPPVIPPISQSGICAGDISYQQGITLSASLHDLPQIWNSSFRGTAVSAKCPPITLGNSVKITPILPSEEGLDGLFAGFQEELRQQRSDVWFPDSPALQDAFEQFCYQDQPVLVEANDISFHQTENISALASAAVPPDKSLTNASSIGFILEFLNRRALFLGDSTPEASAAALQYWQRQTGNPLYFDVIKMPHHGSKRNCLELLDYVDSPLYLISSDGTQYNHPSPETIVKIVFRPTRQTRRIVFNYPHSIYARFSNPEWKSQYRYDVLVAEQIDLMEARYEGTI